MDCNDLLVSGFNFSFIEHCSRDNQMTQEVSDWWILQIWDHGRWNRYSSLIFLPLTLGWGSTQTAFHSW
jgi:hypothetical protein